MIDKAYRFFFVSVFLLSASVPPLHPPAQEILISLEVGMTPGSTIGAARDWMTSVRPLMVFPNELVWWLSIRLDAPAPSALDGPLQLSWECCKDASTRAPVTPRGLYIWALPRPGCEWFPPLGQGYASHMTCRPALSPLTLNMASGPGQAANLVIQTASFVAPGEYIATLHVDSATGTGSFELFITVLPAAWPTDGPAPRCVATLVLPLANLNPVPWKIKHPDDVSYDVAIGFPNQPAGMEMSVVAGSTPIARNTATINFKNNRGWPVGIRPMDSRNCSSGAQFIVAAGATATFTIDRSTTTTLIFSKSSCRAWPPWFDCWGRRGLGLDDVVSFSEGPFWTLFGGRTVNLQTVGDWGAMSTPDSIAVIRTPE